MISTLIEDNGAAASGVEMAYMEMGEIMAKGILDTYVERYADDRPQAVLAVHKSACPDYVGIE